MSDTLAVSTNKTGSVSATAFAGERHSGADAGGQEDDPEAGASCAGAPPQPLLPRPGRCGPSTLSMPVFPSSASDQSEFRCPAIRPEAVCSVC